jgi:hypothetical protein
MKYRIKSNLRHQLEEDEIVTKLKVAIDAFHLHTNKIKDHILDLAIFFDENKLYERNQICRKIKEKLQDKIKEAKITEKWIEDCLPHEYKRRYTKSELTSLSNANKQVLSIIDTQEVKSYAGKESNTNDHKASTYGVTQENIDEFERCVNGLEISKSPVQFSIPREKYENLKAAMEESKAAVYAVFKDGIFQYACSDNAPLV